ncbi:MAG: TetR/AcrR family transcriptional regulator [Candidatus Cloacimonetes bacterium]|nr:TetR/AcrR family transcriptional regulator [Candidatus Cloacimonadota bacterium]
MNKRVIKEKEKRRFNILQAAEKLFLSKGFENVTMQQIALKADFTRRTLYSYFSSKEDLYLAVFFKNSRKRWQQNMKMMDAEDNVVDKLRAYGRANFDYAMKNPRLFRFNIYWEHNGLDMNRVSKQAWQEFSQPQQEAIKHMAAIFHQGIAEGIFRADLDSCRMMRILCITLRSTLNEVILGYESEDFYFNYLDLFIRSILR